MTLSDLKHVIPIYKGQIARLQELIVSGKGTVNKRTTLSQIESKLKRAEENEEAIGKGLTPPHDLQTYRQKTEERKRDRHRYSFSG